MAECAQFTVDRERFDGTAVVSLAGEVDLYTAPLLEEELAVALPQTAETAVVDLSGLTFVDSTTLALLLRAQNRVHRAGGEVALVSGDLNVARVLEITGLDRRFPIFRSLADAVEWLDRAAGARRNGGSG